MNKKATNRSTTGAIIKMIGTIITYAIDHDLSQDLKKVSVKPKLSHITVKETTPGGTIPISKACTILGFKRFLTISCS